MLSDHCVVGAANVYSLLSHMDLRRICAVLQATSVGKATDLSKDETSLLQGQGLMTKPSGDGAYPTSMGQDSVNPPPPLAACAGAGDRHAGIWRACAFQGDRPLYSFNALAESPVSREPWTERKLPPWQTMSRALPLRRGRLWHMKQASVWFEGRFLQWQLKRCSSFRA